MAMSCPLQDIKRQEEKRNTFSMMKNGYSMKRYALCNLSEKHGFAYAQLRSGKTVGFTAVKSY